MSKAMDKGKKKAAAKARKVAATHKGLPQFVASFTLDGKTIQEQRTYRSMDEVEDDRYNLAYLEAEKSIKNREAVGSVFSDDEKEIIRGEFQKKVAFHLVDNRNATEKKRAGVKSCAKEANARKAVREAEDKDNPLGKKEDAQTTADLPPAYKPITADEAVAKFSDIVGELQEANEMLVLMKERHSNEKKEAEADIEKIENRLFELKSSINPAQMDLFRHPAPGPDLEEFDFDPGFDGMDLETGGQSVTLTPVITGAYTGPLHLHVDIAGAPDGLSVAEYLLAVRDCLEREPGVTSVSMAWTAKEPAEMPSKGLAGPVGSETAPDGTTGAPGQAKQAETGKA